MKSIIFLSLFLFPIFLAAQNFKGKPTGSEEIKSSNLAFEKAILDLVNKERKKRRRKPLVWKDALAKSSRYHAKDMAVDGYFDHDFKDKRKRNGHKKVCGVFDRINQFVGTAIFARSENIAVGQMTPEEVMKHWMASKGHRQNILDKDAKYLGVGYIKADGSEWGTYWVQNFGM